MDTWMDKVGYRIQQHVTKSCSYLKNSLKYQNIGYLFSKKKKKLAVAFSKNINILIYPTAL